ncbi:GAF domain-containing sensor histidine kinase [Cryptosporangium arvum]|uniref:histidine kinase n=1 Tax=Cryptosporangium arvum DSM 44712 TaxID=927661 RepID=A0A010YRJ8_9ACTN|nr:GAF domain-containing sensor histidine kinase [Cryptosporangium arvum]EXG82820.1 signal transduction histidine kinase [Cryptosporangium arvum DSM 44712]
MSLDHADVVALLDRQTGILEQITTGVTLPGVLTGIATTFEDLVPGCCCSVLLVDPDAATLRHGAAPSLPAEYLNAIDGLTIGASAGSCGTAAYTGRPVVAVDVRVDARWERYRSLADRFGLRACWSTPIRGRDGVTGTFAVYHPAPHRPTSRERHLVERLTHLAAVAIDHDGAERERRRRVDAELAQQAAEAADRAKTDFVAALGHELRTPLQAITGFTELLGTLELDRDRRAAALEHIGAAADHILAIVDDVLDVARIEANALPLTVAPVALAPVVDDVLAMLDPLASAERVRLHVLAGRPADLLADERRLRQVLLNLVGNAVRYNRADGVVRIGWALDGGRAAITVDDTGPGLAPEFLDRLFVPFDRLGADSEEGVGLGLPLARGLTEAMGGTLQVCSEIGEGTKVTVVLPLA